MDIVFFCKLNCFENGCLFRMKYWSERGDNEIEGIQIAAPTPRWFSDPSVKIKVLSENFCCMSSVKTIRWDEVIESGNLWKGFFERCWKMEDVKRDYVGSLGMNFLNFEVSWNFLYSRGSLDGVNLDWAS